ncbi:hypothetical protein HETIRDRAFT_173435 [Heterobasidion irregulare TC 32-1]|uniref:Uncharacterized protein n=1 Tax=Heterobasidion irregulare (strain TC 32-1) TaxID=747525 RepID=W4K8T6_HETIT|nr:uncharacterized protein HETIRDRAFT_173435 [Heterobasidion irregulare TC 32-1]ETW81760.1 hypothetical protein HETIRDRAFT_173435 [Heterobasidion irregulare TC 32-1]
MPAASPRPSSPFSASPHISPLSTPPNINADPALSASMISVLTTSDEPPELSFDYEWTNGEYVRISRGSTNSQVSSPPTPVDSPELPKMPTLSITDDRMSSSPPVSSSYPHRRVSLSRSESLPGASPSGADRSEPPERRSPATMSSVSTLRPFQRVTSGPSVLLPNHTPSAAISSSSSSVRPSLPDGARASLSKPGGPRRVTMEEYREQAQQNRAKLRAMERELQEEKENFEGEQQSHESPTNGVGVGGPSGRQSPPRPSPIGDPPHFTAQAPSFPTRSFSAGHQPPSTSSNSRALVDVVPVPQRAPLAFPTGPSVGRSIMPGPSRPGRVLRKFQSSFGINKIAEVEAGESDHLDNGSETDTGAEDQAWSDAGRHIDGFVRQPSALASSQITSSSRPRRSASLSEAATAAFDNDILLMKLTSCPDST